jgi:hypothetical protein
VERCSRGRWCARRWCRWGDVGPEPAVVVEVRCGGADDDPPVGFAGPGEAGVDVAVGGRGGLLALVELRGDGRAGGDLRAEALGECWRDRGLALLDPLGDLGELAVDASGALEDPRGDLGVYTDGIRIGIATTEDPPHGRGWVGSCRSPVWLVPNSRLAIDASHARRPPVSGRTESHQRERVGISLGARGEPPWTRVPASRRPADVRPAWGPPNLVIPARSFRISTRHA